MRVKIVIGIISILALLGLGLVLRDADTTAPQKAADPAAEDSYIALGDSVAAGVGLQDSKDASACDRTEGSYPTLLANKQQLNLVDRTCSGASFASGIVGSQTVNQLVTPPQLTAQGNIERVRLITLTAGANDLDWTKLLAQCLATVCDTPENTSLVASQIQTIEPLLSQAIEQLQEYSEATLVITGYYFLFDEATTPCGNTEGITPDEQQWVRTVQRNLNETIKDTARKYPNTRFVAPDFTGHALCASNPYIQGINDPQPYHPTARGQQAIAEAIQKVTTEQ